MRRELCRVVVPDSHGEQIDLAARDACLADIKALNPHEVILLGDHLDCAGTFSTHQRSYTNELAESYEDDCNAANRFLDMIQSRAPRAEMHYLEGNHEAHVERWAARTFPSQKDAEVVLERVGPAAILGLKSRGIRYYRRSRMYMGIPLPGTLRLGRCFFVHGISHSRFATYQHLVRFGTNVVHGHTHRAQSAVERSVTSSGFGAWCPGTLAKLQPLYKHTEPTSWTHGYAVQLVQPSGVFLHINIPIVKGRSLLPRAMRAA